MTTSTPTPTLTVRTPEDVLAAVPVLLGFHPNDSLVMLTVARGGRAFQARIDLPAAGEDPGKTLRLLLDPAREHGVERAILVGYDGELEHTVSVLESAAGVFGAAGIEVAAMLAVHDGRWFPVEPGVPVRVGDGVPFDSTAHAFTAQAVLDGRLVRGSRAELAQSLAADPERAAAVAASGPGSREPDEAAWVTRTVRALLDSGKPAEDATAARLLADLGEPGLHQAARSLARSLARAPDAGDQLEFWSDLVRRAPDDRVAPVAALLAFAAWQAGHGALAWCAVDRCLDADPGYRPGLLVAEVLERAIPPEAWERVKE